METGPERLSNLSRHHALSMGDPLGVIQEEGRYYCRCCYVVIFLPVKKTREYPPRPAPSLPSPAQEPSHRTPGSAHTGTSRPAPRSSSENLSSSCDGGEPGQPTAGTSKGIYKYSRRRKNRHFASSSQPCLSPTPNPSWRGAHRSSCWVRAPDPRHPYWNTVEVSPSELNFCPCLLLPDV